LGLGLWEVGCSVLSCLWEWMG